MDRARPTFDVEWSPEEIVEFTRVRREGDGWIGDTPTWFGDYVFGGWVVGQAVHAACHLAAEGRRLHSLHAYFLRPVAGGAEVSYRARALREGRTFATHELTAEQNGAEVFTMTCSFAADTEGYEYQLAMDPTVPDADVLVTEPGPPPWVQAYVGPTELQPDGTRRSTHRAWIKVGVDLPDDAALHAALVGFATDWTGTGGRPLHLDGDVEGMISLDHAVWFHRAVRADEWLFYDVHSVVNTGGRGLLRGTMYGPDRRVAVSVAQEMLLRPVEPA